MDRWNVERVGKKIILQPHLIIYIIIKPLRSKGFLPEKPGYYLFWYTFKTKAPLFSMVWEAFNITP